MKVQGAEHRIDVAGTGFTVLDRIYADGGLTDEALGGSCGNVLISLAMLHRQVAPVLALGDDDAGERLVEEFARAGATVGYITRRTGMRSPILSQQLDTGTGKHQFSFICPDTHEELPRYWPVSEDEISSALPVLTSCRVFYADRVSAVIVGAMRTAKDAGAIVFFEPSDVEEGNLFGEALGLSTIVKYSEERLGEKLGNLKTECIRIVTYGAAGLEVQDRSGTYWCRAIEAPRVLDTCGSGDMVSVGVIDWVLTSGSTTGWLGAAGLLQGVVAGQRLAAQNCAYSGARGLFKSRGAAYARAILRGRFCSIGTE